MEPVNSWKKSCDQVCPVRGHCDVCNEWFENNKWLNEEQIRTEDKPTTKES